MRKTPRSPVGDLRDTLRVDSVSCMRATQRDVSVPCVPTLSPRAPAPVPEPASAPPPPPPLL